MSDAPRRAVVLGATGQLGGEIVAALAARHHPIGLGHGEADVTDLDGLRRALVPLAPEWVVSTAAFHDVDAAETDPARALAVNALGAANAAAVARELGAGFAWISTDYVFSGTAGRPLVESDPAAPLNVYGVSKLAGEALVCIRHPRALVVRTAALFGPRPCRGKGGRSFVDSMLRLGRERARVRVVDDEVTSPTFTPHLARAVVAALEAGADGVLHLAGGGACSWFELATAAFELAGLDAKVERAAPGEFPRKAPRPAFSALTSERLDRLGLAPLPAWREGLRAHLAAGGAGR